jgi:arginase
MSKKIQIVLNKSEVTAGTRGASLGPESIMAAARKKMDPFFQENTPVWIENFNDILDQPIKHQFAKRIESLEKIALDLKKNINEQIENGVFPLIIAGDHGSAAGTIAGVKSSFPDKTLGVVWIDAHGDLHTPYTTPSGNMHGMPLALAMSLDNKECQRNDVPAETEKVWQRLQKSVSETPNISPENLLFIGVRDTEKEENYLIKKHGIRNITVDEFRSENKNHWENELNDFIAKVDVLYVSFDVDSMDPDVTSYGTGTPVPHGITPDEAQWLLNFFAREKKLECLEFVEVNPCLDNKCNTMAEITFELIKNTVGTLKGRN